MFPTFTSETQRRWARSSVFFATGAAGVIGGGVAAAVTGPTDWSHGSWVAAFLVLVVGVAQLGLGVGQAALAPTLAQANLVAAEAVTWNLGSAGVIAGTLAGLPVLVTISSAVFLVAVALAAMAVRGHSALSGRTRAVLAVYRVLLLVLLVSTPIGILLSFVRH